MDERMVQDAVLRRRIGARVFFLRRDRGITALKLAAQAGLHRNTLYRIEAGMRSCSIGQLHRIAQALSVKVDDFLENAPNRVHFASGSEKAQ